MLKKNLLVKTKQKNPPRNYKQTFSKKIKKYTNTLQITQKIIKNTQKPKSRGKRRVYQVNFFLLFFIIALYIKLLLLYTTQKYHFPLNRCFSSIYSILNFIMLCVSYKYHSRINSIYTHTFLV